MKAIIIGAIIQLLKRVTIKGLVSLAQQLVAAAENNPKMSGKEKFEFVFNMLREQPEFKSASTNMISWVIETAVAWLNARK